MGEDEDEDDVDEEEMDRLALQKKKYDGLLMRARRMAAFEKSKACHDKNGECPTWQRLGECMKNPEYMLSECKVSCGVCVDRDERPNANAMPATRNARETIAASSELPTGDATAPPGTKPSWTVAQSAEVVESMEAVENSSALKEGAAANVVIEDEIVDLKMQYEDMVQRRKAGAAAADDAADGVRAAETETHDEA